MTMKLSVNTNQEAFDIVRAHLLAMTRRSQTVTGFCMYRLEHDRHGNRCAIGALIPDSEYVSIADSGTVGNLISRGDLDIGDVSLPLLRELQSIHDASENWSYTSTTDVSNDVALNARGHAEFVRLAKTFELTVPS